jgi:hypothetical protein
VVAFGRRCQRELVARAEAEDLASQHDIFLEGLGGTCGGMIGALAAVGLARTANDGRVVVNGEWPDDLSGRQAVAVLADRHVVVQCLDSDRLIREGVVDVGKRLRPNLRDGRIVQFVHPELNSDSVWQAVRLN